MDPTQGWAAAVSLIHKAELHLHLSGSISDAVLQKFIAEDGDDAASLTLVQACRTLSDCFAIFRLIHKHVSSAERLIAITSHVYNECVRDNVSYVELRTTPRIFPKTAVPGLLSPASTLAAKLLLPAGCFMCWESSDDTGGHGRGDDVTYRGIDLDPSQSAGEAWAWALARWEPDMSAYVSVVTHAIVRSTEQATKAATQGTVVPTVRLLLSINRADGMGAAEKTVALAIIWSRVRWALQAGGGTVGHDSNSNAGIGTVYGALPGRMVVGIDVSGDPTSGNAASFFPLLDIARSAGLRITIHAGEVVSPQEVQDVLAWRPDRLGHMCVLEDGTMEKLLKSARNAATAPSYPLIPIELCPTSNVFTLNLAAAPVAVDEGIQQNRDSGGTGIVHVQSTAAPSGFFSGTTPDAAPASPSGSHVLHSHPTLLPLLRAGYPICVCTDDSGVFRTTLSQELSSIAQAAGWATDCRDDLHALARLITSSFQHAFLDGEPDIREELLHRARERAAQVLGLQPEWHCR